MATARARAIWQQDPEVLPTPVLRCTAQGAVTVSVAFTSFWLFRIRIQYVPASPTTSVPSVVKCGPMVFWKITSLAWLSCPNAESAVSV